MVPPFVVDEVDFPNHTYPPEIVAAGWSGDKDNYTVRFSGEFFADHDGDYSFQEHVDDEAWLVVNGSEVLHNNQWNVPTDETIPLSIGWHTIEFRTREGGGGDYKHLSWDPAGGTDFQIMTEADARFRTAFEFDYVIVNMLAEGDYNVGDPLGIGSFGLNLDPGHHTLRLTVDYLGETGVIEQDVVVPEPTTLALLGLGLLAAVRRRRRG
jgi:hypothetical protein